MKRLGMSERQYTAYAGISRGAVSKAGLSGRLVLHLGGSIDAGRSDHRRDSTTDPSQQRGRHASNLWPVPQAAVGGVAETLKEQGLLAPQASGKQKDVPGRRAAPRTASPRSPPMAARSEFTGHISCRRLNPTALTPTD